MKQCEYLVKIFKSIVPTPEQRAADLAAFLEKQGVDGWHLVCRIPEDCIYVFSRTWEK